MRDRTTFVGLDAHKDSISVAVLLPDREEPIEWQLSNESAAIKRMAKRIRELAPSRIAACYEAGPCGYSLQRQLKGLEIECQVVAPSLIPVKPGCRVKTDRRDALKLAELHRAGLLTAVHPPTAEEEAVRDLCRAREDAVEDLLRCRHRVSKLLLRRGLRNPAGQAWTVSHRKWLRSLSWDYEADRAVFESYLLALEQTEERIKTLDLHLEREAAREPYRQPVAWLRCFRGIDTVVALGVVAELHDFRRFRTPRELMAYLGLVPSEYSSSESRRQGSITKTGNSHVRRLLVEAAWHYQRPFNVGYRLKKRREGQPAWVIALADRAGQRLHRRFYRLTARGKPSCKANIAVARELAGFIWAALRPETVTN